MPIDVPLYKADLLGRASWRAQTGRGRVTLTSDEVPVYRVVETLWIMYVVFTTFFQFASSEYWHEDVGCRYRTEGYSSDLP